MQQGDTYLKLLPQDVASQAMLYLRPPAHSFGESIARFHATVHEILCLVADEQLHDIVLKSSYLNEASIENVVNKLLFDSFINACAEKFFDAGQYVKGRIRIALELGSEEACRWVKNQCINNLANKKAAQHLLCESLLHGRINELRFLLKAGVSPRYSLEDAELSEIAGSEEIRHLKNRTPLSIVLHLLRLSRAARFDDQLRNNLIAARLLIIHNADVNAPDSGLISVIRLPPPFYIQKELVGLMLNHGANINGRENQRGDTPLIVAVRSRNSAMVEFLSQRGSDDSLQNKMGIGAHDLLKELRDQYFPDELNQ